MKDNGIFLGIFLLIISIFCLFVSYKDIIQDSYIKGFNKCVELGDKND